MIFFPRKIALFVLALMIMCGSPSAAFCKLEQDMTRKELRGNELLADIILDISKRDEVLGNRIISKLLAGKENVCFGVHYYGYKGNLHYMVNVGDPQARAPLGGDPFLKGIIHKDYSDIVGSFEDGKAPASIGF